MYLIPKPKQITYLQQSFHINGETEIILDQSCNLEDFEVVKSLREEIYQSSGIEVAIHKAFHSVKGSIYLKRAVGDKESYTLEINENGIELCGGDGASLFYGVQTLRQIIRQQGTKLSGLSIMDAPHFEHRGFYHDVTRGKVPTLSTLKELVDRLSFYKVNQLQLYVEHTFAFKNLSQVWLGKDPLTAQEILELDVYCRTKNVELVPSLATFGHLYEILSTKSLSHLCELEDSYGKPFSWFERMAHHTLDVSNEDSFKLIQMLLDEYIPLFSSNKFNICCDETFDLGKGKNTKRDAEFGTDKLYIDFLNKIINYVQGFHKEVMFWGDIIVKNPECLKEIPEGVVCLNWNYSPEAIENDTKTIAAYGVKQYVCPGVGGWNRLMNAMDSSFQNISRMISYGEKYGAVGVLNTDWGDYGHINLFGNSMPGMIFGAALSWNPKDQIEFQQFDECISVLDFGDNTKKVMSLLRELSRQEVASWQYIVWWREQKLIDDTQLNNILEEFHHLDHKKMSQGYARAIEIEKELFELAKHISENRRLDLQEFANSARGIALMNAACLTLMKYEFQCNEVDVVMEGKPLAEAMERWFEGFSSLWRKRNKESELYRIKDTITCLCSFLRDTALNEG